MTSSANTKVRAIIVALVLVLAALLLFGSGGSGGRNINIPFVDTSALFPSGGGDASSSSSSGSNAAAAEDIVGGRDVEGIDERYGNGGSDSSHSEGSSREAASSAAPADAVNAGSSGNGRSSPPSSGGADHQHDTININDKHKGGSGGRLGEDGGDGKEDGSAFKAGDAGNSTGAPDDGDHLPQEGASSSSVTKGGLLRVDGDAAGEGPREVLLRLLRAIPSGGGAASDGAGGGHSYLEDPLWRTKKVSVTGDVAPLRRAAPDAPWPSINYNRSLSRPIPEEYSQGSAASEAFFKAIAKRGVLPRVVNSSRLVDGPLIGEAPDAVLLSDIKGMLPTPGGINIYTKVVTSEPEEVQRFRSIADANAHAARLEDLEYVTTVPAVHAWLRPLNETAARWARRDEESYAKNMATSPLPPRSRAAVRVACLYAGFVRDYIRMFISCMDKMKSARKCREKHVNKLYGNQRENILDSSGCDVYASTWDIVGTGRYDVKDYKMDVKYNIPQLKAVYGARLGGLHVQQYSVYERVWKLMATRARAFPQTRPTSGTKFPATWKGAPENNFVFRVNDYSQSYKHWCVVQLALLSGFEYDLFFRLRMDLRAVREIGNFRFATVVDDEGEGERHEAGGVRDDLPPMERRAIAYDISSFKEEGGGALINTKGLNYSTHYLHYRKLHVQNFDYADFGFMATPSVIHSLAAVWYYCLMPPVRIPAGGSGGEPFPIHYLAPDLKPSSEVISEYNLVVWRIVWDNAMAIDNGGFILRISRRAEVKGVGAGRKRRR